ncbi:DNA methylase [Ligilactobacillus sp. LYQ60]|uniref:Y-family DNA polymerase n=1 Tax=Ligilactobacillus sp. LYQ60 TaxID=3378799 RepID=UPI0038530F4B
MNKVYIAIDLKSFYASVECRALGYDPLTTNLVVADESRTDKTICLAVSPALKAFGVPGRPRLFQVKEIVRQFNHQRVQRVLGKRLIYSSIYRPDILHNPAMGLDFVVAKPRMELYEDVSAQIFGIYLNYIAPEDIHVYSIDEAFIDATGYLTMYDCTAQELADRMINDVFNATGITATVGIGPNLYLAKIAMDIMAKRMTPTQTGYKVATLSVKEYRQRLWNHQPLTDFWQIGPGYAHRLNQLGLHTMGEIAACSVGTLDQKYNADLLYRTFGIKAELLIDHAWGMEPLTIQDIKQYRPEHQSLSVGQVLPRPYTFAEGLTIINEMSAELALRLTKHRQGTKQIILSVRYDKKTPVPLTKHRLHATVNLPQQTNLTSIIQRALRNAFCDQVNSHCLIRKISLTAIDIHDHFTQEFECLQTNLFEQKAPHNHHKEEQLQQTTLDIHSRFGKNALLTAEDLAPYARTQERNQQIGGHHA